MEVRGSVQKFKPAKNKDPYWRVRLLSHREDRSLVTEWQPEHFSSRKAANDHKNALLVARRQQPAQRKPDMTIKVLTDEWLNQESKPTVKEGTQDLYESVCRVHIQPALGRLTLAQVDHARVALFREHMVKAGRKERLVTVTVGRLSQAFDYAMRRGYVSANPCKGLKPLSRPHREMLHWTPSEVKTFLSVANKHSYHPYWLLALHTGMRRGELLGLRWQDVDLQRGLLRVQRSLNPGVSEDGSLRIGSTKTGRSRVIDLSEETVRVLRNFRKQHPSDELVIPSAAGTHLSPRNVNRALYMLINMIGVPVIRLHDLRHTHATILLAAGVPVKVVSERLGHASVSITLNIYAHVLPGAQKQAADIFSLALKGATANPPAKKTRPGGAKKVGAAG